MGHASDVNDTSLRVPPGINGTVLNLKIFTRDGIPKDNRTQSIISEDLNKYKKNLDYKTKTIKYNLFKKVKKFLNGKILKVKKENETLMINNLYLNKISLKEIVKINLKIQSQNKFIIKIKKFIESVNRKFNFLFREKRKKVTQCNELPSGVLKMIKIFLSVKHRLQPGDKMSGRHGNKGVVSKIVPIEDMPYMSDGSTIDILLNPLGVPSRMNVGQVLETHLGWASKGIGLKIEDLLIKKDIFEIRFYMNELYKNYRINFFQILIYLIFVIT